MLQVGGKAGSALGPLLAAFVVAPRGQGSLAYFSVAAVAAMVLLTRVAVWYEARLAARPAKSPAPAGPALPRRTVALSLAVLLALAFSKNFYLVSLSSFYTFYLAAHRVVAFLPLVGLLAAFLPDLRRPDLRGARPPR